MRDMYRCCNCGKIFHISEVKKVDEDKGEFWGAPCYETMLYSPCCTDDFEEYDEKESDEDE